MDPAIANAPVEQPPKGRTANLVNPFEENLHTVTITLVSIASILGVVFVVLRGYARACLRTRPTLDDYACFLAMVGSLLYASVTLEALHRGLGVHHWNLKVKDFNGVLALEIVLFTAGYTSAICMAKLSLFLLYLRLFSVDKLTRRLIHLGIGTTSLFYLAATLSNIIACSPWKGESRLEALGYSRCVRQQYLGYVVPAFNVLSDFYLLILAINIVRKLQMPRRKKIGVISIFMLGFLGCICSVINSYYRVKLERASDHMWDIIPVIITSIFEINVGIIVGCMPYLAPMMRSGTSKVLRAWSHIKTVMTERFPFRKRFKTQDYSLTQIGSGKAADAYLDTRVLAGADGKGKFLQPSTLQNKSWWQTSRNDGETTTACYSEV
ncbi:MAG: hypothetical protein Q9192_002730 [Flavoplaca navasiana]